VLHLLIELGFRISDFVLRIYMDSIKGQTFSIPRQPCPMLQQVEPTRFIDKNFNTISIEYKNFGFLLHFFLKA